MRILGAKFHDRPAALLALRDVRHQFGPEFAVAPLADGDATAMLLAGEFEDGVQAEARLVLLRHGGEIVSDVDARLAS